jgi:Zn-dependent protease with chaperone function
MHASDCLFKRRVECLLVRAVLRPDESMPRVVVDHKLRLNAVVSPAIPFARRTIAISRDLQFASDSLLIGVLAHELGHAEGKLNRAAGLLFLTFFALAAIASFVLFFAAPAQASLIVLVASIPAVALTLIFRTKNRIYNALESEADAMAVRRLGSAYHDMHAEFLDFVRKIGA